MAKSFDNLLEFLLEEIALCGAQGASSGSAVDWIHSDYSTGAGSAEVKSFVESFYATPDDDTTLALDLDSRIRKFGKPQKASLDRKLIEKIWTWIVKHPDVTFANDESEPHISLGEFEALEQASAVDGGEEARKQPRLFTSPGRTWYALTGHGVDIKRIPQKEFDLLSIIASSRKNGILQPELVKASGQDKRSVPKRTDQLHDKGYIVKEGVMTNRIRTTRLTLKRFKETETDAKKTASEESSSGAVFMNQSLVYDHLLDTLLELFAKFNNLISLKGLKKTLVGQTGGCLTLNADFI
jgi:DNA-binding MarR family transcriptional regulator